MVDRKHGFGALRGGRRRAGAWVWVASAASLGGLLGCAEVRQTEHVDPVGAYCMDCHDFATMTPDRRSAGFDAESARTHRAHVIATETRDAVPCERCHVVPEVLTDDGHLDADRHAEVRLDALVGTHGQAATYDPATRTCTNVSCHGGDLRFDTPQPTPAWGAGDPLGCDGCHGAPPARPHPQDDACGGCHSAVMDLEGAFSDPGRHIDGHVEPVSLTCDSCHGSSESDAPPRDLAGNDSVSARGVGAHQQHLAAAIWHAPIVCEDCHVVPDEPMAPGHFDTELPAELVWSARATDAGALEPRFDPETLRCSQVYCHGGNVGGGTAPEPVWTVIDGTQITCGGCHDLPPRVAHPDRDDCSTCHDTVDADRNIIDGARHVDGVVDGSTGCSTCHGGGDDPTDPVNQAPPRDVSGNSDVTAPGVGAHRAHLEPSDWRATIDCAACHTVPLTVYDAGHIEETEDDAVTWAPGSIARRDGAEPRYDYETYTCSGVYCHGATLAAGDVATTPTWTLLDGSGAACGSACHALPPAAPHPNASACSDCHSAVVDRTGGIVCAELHVDGRPDLGPMACP